MTTPNTDIALLTEKGHRKLIEARRKAKEYLRRAQRAEKDLANNGANKALIGDLNKRLTEALKVSERWAQKYQQACEQRFDSLSRITCEMCGHDNTYPDVRNPAPEAIASLRAKLTMALDAKAAKLVDLPGGPSMTLAKLFALADYREQAQFLNEAGRKNPAFMQIQVRMISAALDNDGKALVTKLAEFLKRVGES